MAIIQEVPGIKVTILVGGQEATEYDAHDGPDPPPHCPTSLKYVECVDEAEFSIKLEVDVHYAWGFRNHCLSLRTYVDGKSIAGRVVRSENVFPGFPWTKTVIGKRELDRESGLWFSRKLKFTGVQIVDDSHHERVQRDLNIAKGLGVIEVRVLRVINNGLEEARPRLSSRNQELNTFELAEKSLKGKSISHGASFSPPEQTSKPISYNCRTLPEDNGSIAVFQFHYRSKEALKRELIIPRTPSLSPTIGPLSPAERNRLAQQRLNNIRNKPEIKPEPVTIIKRELGEIYDLTSDDALDGPKKRSRLCSVQAEIVDLTGD